MKNEKKNKIKVRVIETEEIYFDKKTGFIYHDKPRTERTIWVKN